MPERSVRFGITDHAGRRTETWKCWTQVGAGKRDVYLACRALKGKVKLSMHQSGCWHVAFDANQFPSMFEKESEPANRFVGKWNKPAPLVQGLTLACRVHSPWYGVTIPVTSLDENVFWIQAAPRGKSIEVVLFLSGPDVPRSDSSGWPGRRTMNTNLVGSIELDGGGYVWVVYHAIPLVEPKLPSHPSPRYFRGVRGPDLHEPGLRAVVWGPSEDGSIVLFEAPVLVSENT